MALLEFSWFHLALIHAFLTTGGYLCLKEVQRRGASNEGSLSLFFSFLLLTLFVWSQVTPDKFIWPPLNLIGWLFVAGLLAGTANLLLLHSFAKSPNPGFSLALSSISTLGVVGVSVLFLEAVLSWLALIGILSILFGVFLIHHRNGPISWRWEWPALISACVTVLYWTIIKITQTILPEIQPSVILVLVVIPQLLIFVIVRYRRLNLSKLATPLTIGWLAIGGVTGALGNILSLTAVFRAPNPGYPLAIASVSTLLVIFVSRFVFHSSLERRLVLATIIIIAGVALIRFGSL